MAKYRIITEDDIREIEAKLKQARDDLPKHVKLEPKLEKQVIEYLEKAHKELIDYLWALPVVGEEGVAAAIAKEGA